MSNRWDETWHRLLLWTNGQGPSERLAGQVLMSEGYADLDPSHPLGGPDGGKDALTTKDGKKWVMAVYFPRGQQTFGAIKKKLLGDLRGVAANNADALVFVTNQELTLGERDDLKKAAGLVPVELYHLDRITLILDQQKMSSVREQFLGIGDDDHGSRVQGRGSNARGADRGGAASGQVRGDDGGPGVDARLDGESGADDHGGIDPYASLDPSNPNFIDPYGQTAGRRGR